MFPRKQTNRLFFFLGWTLCLLCSPGLFAAGKKPESAPGAEKVVGAEPFPDAKRFFRADGAPDYRAYHRDYWVFVAGAYLTPAKDAEIKNLKHIGLGSAVVSLLDLARDKGDEKYLARAHDLFGILLDYSKDNKEMSRDCFGYPGVLAAALALKAAGRFDAAWEPVLRRFTQDGAGAINQRFPAESDGNQDLARMFGCVLAKKLFPDMADAVSAKAKVDAAFTRIIKQGDIFTDSLNYFGVSLFYFFQIAHELGREGEIAQSPTFKRMFANFRDAVSPNGYMPEFGSGYFGPNNYPLTPVYLEYAAALYQDGSFSVAARRYYNMLIQAGPIRPPHAGAALHMGGMSALPILDLFKPFSGPLPPPEFISGVTRRIAKFGGERPGFLIMRPSLTPGAPMVLMDLLGLGDHCQPEFTASIAYYETDHVPHFYQYGRYICGASRANQVVFGEAGTTEPDPAWKANAWRTLAIPAERFVGETGIARIEQVSLRTDARTKSADSGLVLDNLRLSGPAGTKVICDLGRGVWKGNKHSAVPGKKAGTETVSILNDSLGCTMQKFNGFTFDPKEYVELLCDVKWFGKARPSAQLRMTQEYRSWTAVEASTLLAILKDARVDRLGDDCRARLEYSSYGTFDSTLVRQIVLTREGVLAVRDDILPGKSAEGRPAFTLWQMYSIDAESGNRFSTRGECAFPSAVLSDTKRYRRGMSVFFSGGPGMVAGKQVIPGGRLGNYKDIQRDLDLRTAYARLTLQAGKQVCLAFLVTPHAPEADLAKLDAATSAAHESGQSVFKTACDGAPVRVEIQRDGKWKVER